MGCLTWGGALRTSVHAPFGVGARAAARRASRRLGPHTAPDYDRPIDPRRRALFVIAVVLGTSMVAASLVTPPPDRDGRERAEDARQRDRGRGGSPPRAEAEPGRERAAARAARVRFDAGAESPQTRTLREGVPATVVVEVPVPGEVAVPALGRYGFADPRTPARFDLLARRPGRFTITFATPEQRPKRAGTLVVTRR